MDWHIEESYLKFTPSLHNILVQSTTEDVELHVNLSSELFHSSITPIIKRFIVKFPQGECELLMYQSIQFNIVCLLQVL